jgi:hypothetical protein
MPRSGAAGALHPYASEAYARTFPFESVWLPGSRTHVLLRPISGTERVDAMGCYPLCVLSGTDGLDADFALLRSRGVVSLVLVTDCLSQPGPDALAAKFDVCRPFKKHYTHDATAPNADYSKHHRDRVRRALKSCEVREVPLAEHLDEWMKCYGTLVAKKGISGIQDFDRSYFEKLAAVPGFFLVGAFVEGRMESGHIWLRHERLAYAHLAASTPVGYKLRCAFPIYDYAIRALREHCVIDFGGGAGLSTDGQDGLSQFKRGFANGERMNLLCGKVLNPEAYASLTAGRGVGAATFFPAYRAPTPQEPT